MRLNLAVSGSGVYVARPVDSARGHKTTAGGFNAWSQRVSRVVLSFLVLMLASVFVFGGTTQEAKANIFLDGLKDVFCSTVGYFNEPQPWSNGLTALGMSGAAGSPAGTAGQVLNNKVSTFFGGDKYYLDVQRTAYEKYGMSGTNWTVYGGEHKLNINKDERVKIDKNNEEDLRVRQSESCIPVMGLVGTASANSIFGVTKFVTSIAGWLVGVVYDPAFVQALNDKAASIIAGEDGRKGLRDTLYFPFLNLIIMLGAVHLFWVGIVKRQSSTAATSAIWMVGAVMVGSIFVYNPSLLPNFTEDVIGQVNSAVLTGTAGNVTGGTNICASEDRKEKGLDSKREMVVRGANCTFWQTFVFSPWAVGQWGVPYQALHVDETPPHPNGIRPTVDLGRGAKVENWALYQVDLQTISSDEKGADSLTAWVDNYMEWHHIVDYVAAPGGAQQYFTDWSGNNATDRVLIAIASLVAAVAGLVVIVSLSLTAMGYAIGNALLVFMAVFFFLAGAHPGLGRRLAMRWAEMFVSTILKRVVLAALLAVVMAFYSVLLNDATNDWGITIVAIIALSVAVMIYRKEILDSVGNVNFGGTGFSEKPASRTGALVKGVAAGAVMGAAGSAVGATRAGAAAAARPGLTGAAKTRAAMGAAAKVMGRSAGQGMVTGATHAGGFMSNPTVQVAKNASGRAKIAASEEQKATDARIAEIAREQQEREAEEAARIAEEQEKAARQAEIARRKADPTFIAQETRARQSRSQQYRRDYQQFGKDAQWRSGFKKTYGFEPPNPDKYDFGGYGMQLKDIQEKGAAYLPAPRPRAPEPTVSSAATQQVEQMERDMKDFQRRTEDEVHIARKAAEDASESVEEVEKVVKKRLPQKPAAGGPPPRPQRPDTPPPPRPQRPSGE